MDKIFLSFSFREEDRTLVSQVERLIRSHSILPVTGKQLGGEALTLAVQQRIDSCDGLVSLLTRRERLASGQWTTHNWVRDELNYARNQGKRAIALIEDDVDHGGSFGENQWLALNRASPEEALLSLSETIGLWRRESGRRLKIQILPQTLAEKAAMSASEPLCNYRYMRNGEFSAWIEAKQVPETGGTFVYLRGLPEDALVQIKIAQNTETWQSVATPSQSLPVELKQIGGV